jgi:hypothetical protein
MHRLVSLALLVGILSPSLPGKGPVQIDFITRFDEFGDIKCEDEYARLDNFAVQLQQEPQARGVIMFYGGQTFRGKLPKRGEAEARAARLKPYLVERRGIPSDRLVVVNGGYKETWQVTLRIIPPGIETPGASPTVPLEKVKFRKGKANPRDYRCGI